MMRCKANVPIPLYDEKGHQVRVVAPGESGVIVEEYTRNMPGAFREVPRALVRWVKDYDSGPWDVDRSMIGTGPR